MIETADRSITAEELASGTDWTIEIVIRRHIMRVYELTRHNLSETARRLGIPRSTLRNKMKKFDVRKP
jgi:ActR/RegA family two-component response regulator